MSSGYAFGKRPQLRALKSLSSRPPASRTGASRNSFVGRELELLQLQALYAGGARLCSILGAGGCGKTRLASQFTSRLASQPVVFVELAQARTPAALVESVARALELPLPPSAELGLLVAHVGQALSERPGLLVLDNFEQLLPPSRWVLESWLDAALGLTLLVTSRERLRISGEHSLELGPLSLPQPDQDRDAILSGDAVRLFLARARSIRHDFEPSSEQIPVLAELVQKLEGLPLAIELCAARIGVLGLGQLLERLEHGLDTLVDRAARAPRQATLRATLEWSWQLLDSDEKRVLAQCAVFRGGFDIAAAEAVLSSATPVLELLEALIDKSLICAKDNANSERRYSLLESVRELCGEKLSVGETQAVIARHEAHYLERGGQRGQRAVRQSSVSDRQWLELESPNLLAVHRRALDRGDGEAALRAALSLEAVFLGSGPLASFVALLDQALDAFPAGAADRARRGRFARAFAKLHSGDYAGSLPDFAAAARGDDALAAFAQARHAVAQSVLGQHEQADRELQLASKLLATLSGDDFSAGQIEAAYAIVRSAQGRFDEALGHHQRAAKLFDHTGSRREQASAESGMGYLYLERGALSEAEHHLRQALLMLDGLGDRRREAHALADMCVIAVERGQHDRAAELVEKVLSLSHSVGDHHWVGVVHGYAGQNELERGDIAEARRHFELAAERLEKVGDRRWASHFRGCQAASEALLGRHVKSAELFAQAEHDCPPQTERERAALEGWRWVARLVLPDSLPDGASAEQYLQRTERLTGTELRCVVRVLRSVLADSCERRLQVASDAAWFELDGTHVSIARRGNLRRILNALLEAREASAAADVERLFAAGWPGQQVRPDSAAHRVHVAVGTLRKLGLGQALRTTSDGYALDPSLRVERVAS